jgi:hypothetical protein
VSVSQKKSQHFFENAHTQQPKKTKQDSVSKLTIIDFQSQQVCIDSTFKHTVHTVRPLNTARVYNTMENCFKVVKDESLSYRYANTRNNLINYGACTLFWKLFLLPVLYNSAIISLFPSSVPTAKDL